MKTTLATVRAKIAVLRGAGTKWREIGERYPGVPLGTLSRIYSDAGYDPRKATIRAALGLPITAPAPVCPRHDVVHTGRCPRPTFEERAAKYDRWRTANVGKIEMIVRWAEKIA